MNEYQEKIRTIGVSRRRGTSNRKPVIDDRDGTIGGYQTEHWDGRQDAQVIVKPVNLKAKAQEGEST